MQTLSFSRSSSPSILLPPLLKTITIYSYCLTNIWSSPSRDIYHDNFPWPVVPAIREGRIMRRIQIGDFFIFLSSACCFVDQMPSLSWSVMMPACSKLLLRRCFSLGVNGQFTLLSYCHVRLLALHSYCAEQVFRGLPILESPCHQSFQTEIELDKVNSAIILIWIWVCFSFIFCNDPGFLTSFCERHVWSDGSYSDPAPEQFQFWGCFYLVIESPSTRDRRPIDPKY